MDNEKKYCIGIFSELQISEMDPSMVFTLEEMIKIKKGIAEFRENINRKKHDMQWECAHIIRNHFADFFERKPTEKELNECLEIIKDNVKKYRDYTK